jgi:hypothetical protein
MGLFYTNIILYKAQQQQVADFLRNPKRIAYVSPTQDNFTVVYDKETEDQDTRVLKNITSLLTKRFRCKALASLVHDSDVYMYWLYENGKLLDTYNSIPGYFDAEVNQPLPEGGDAKKLCEAFDKLNAVSEIQGIFKLVEKSNLDEASPEEYLGGEDIHGAIVRALGMPSFSAFIGYFTIENAEISEELDRTKLIEIV